MQMVLVTTLDDEIAEQSESFMAMLSEPSDSLTIGPMDSATITIYDNDNDGNCLCVCACVRVEFVYACTRDALVNPL